MTKIFSLLIVGLMIVHIIKPLGLPGLRHRRDFWKLAIVALAAMGFETDVRKLRLKGFRPLLLGGIASLFIANVMLLILNVPLVRLFVKFLSIPNWLLVPGVAAISPTRRQTLPVSPVGPVI